MAQIDLVNKSADERAELIANAKRGTVFLVPLDRKTDVQVREKTDLDLAKEYKEKMAAGENFPPSDAVYEKDADWFHLHDGIHTSHALIMLDKDRKSIPATVTLGSKLDALMLAGKRNDKHGKKPTQADKRHQIAMYLRTPELGAASNNFLAKLGGVAPQTVESVREQLESDPDNPLPRPDKRRVSRNGKTYDIDAPNSKEANSKKEAPPTSATPDDLIKRLTGYLSKRLASVPAEERAEICQALIKAIGIEYIVPDNIS